MSNAAISRRSLFQGVAAAGTAAGLLSVGAARAQAASLSFDLLASSFPVFSGVGLTHNTVLQSFAFDSVAKKVFVAQITGYTEADRRDAGEHARVGDLTINELSWDGVLLGDMKVQGCGHGFAIGAAHNADGGTEIYLEFDADVQPLGSSTYGDPAYGRMTTHIPYQRGRTYTKTELSAHLHNPRPGSYFNSCTIDPTTDRIAVRYQPVKTDVAKKVAIWSRSDFLGSRYSLALADVALPAVCYTDAQGFTLHGDFLYFLSGKPQTQVCPGTQATSTAKLVKYNWRTKTVVQTANTYAYVDLMFREPEGMAIQLVNGAPRLTFGFAGRTSCTDPNAKRTVNIAYKDQLV